MFRIAFGMVWYGVVWCDVVWYGIVWCGVGWFCVVRCGVAKDVQSVPFVVT